MSEEITDLLAILEETRKIERERCAKIAELFDNVWNEEECEKKPLLFEMGKIIAKAIRDQD